MLSAANTARALPSEGLRVSQLQGALVAMVAAEQLRSAALAPVSTAVAQRAASEVRAHGYVEGWLGGYQG